MPKFEPIEPTKLPVYSWGDGVADVRFFTTQILMPSEIAAVEASGYIPRAYNLEGAIRALKLTLKDVEPGIYFAGNPLESTYGKWCCALKAAGWTQVPGCALNRVWGNWEAYKGPGSKNSSSNPSAPPWESPDGFHKWMHAFYTIVPGRKGPIKFDFSEKTRNLQAPNGDADLHAPTSKGSLWHINYGGSSKMLQRNTGGAKWCHNFARLSKSCGVALGYGLPECGADLDEEFYTIAGLELDKAPEGWTTFVEYGGLRFAHNIRKLTTGQVECPHAMQV